MSEFKNYPEEEPSYNGTNYLTIIEYADTYSYAFTYMNKDAVWHDRFYLITQKLIICRNLIIHVRWETRKG